MILECERYGHRWNSEVSKFCVICYPRKRPKQKQERISGDVFELMHDTVRTQRRVVNSHRRASLTKWEREHGSQVGNK